MTNVVDRTELRARFARRLSTLYGSEVPAYTTLVDVTHEVNERVLTRDGSAAQRLGSISRVSAERHGAIRVGTGRELAQVAQVFAALGMQPVGFYDLRDATPRPVPVVSTAFRPVEATELARNPFRVFTSVLVTADRRFFDADLEQRLERFLNARQLFPEELLVLASRGEAEHGLEEADADRFLELAAGAFALSTEPVDRAWYAELERISSVAADIGGVGSTHINHLTPRVLDIDELYLAMRSRGITMIDRIQGPPRWSGPDVLLRQTSFRALSEPRRFREPDGTVTQGQLRVRFGEVEQRGLALTPHGRDSYDRLVALVDDTVAVAPDRDRQDVAAEVWARHFPTTEAEVATQGLGWFRYDAVPGTTAATTSLAALLAHGVLHAEPIVYEDFLPRSAAGIFASNLSGGNDVNAAQGDAPRDAAWLADAIGRPVHDPQELYAAQQSASLRRAGEQLGLAEPILQDTADGGAVVDA